MQDGGDTKIVRPGQAVHAGPQLVTCTDNSDTVCWNTQFLQQSQLVGLS